MCIRDRTCAGAALVVITKLNDVYAYLGILQHKVNIYHVTLSYCSIDIDRVLNFTDFVAINI